MNRLVWRFWRRQSTVYMLANVALISICSWKSSQSISSAYNLSQWRSFDMAPLSFLDLPLEIRNMIYTDLFQNHVIHRHTDEDEWGHCAERCTPPGKRRALHVSLFLTCKQIKTEVEPIYVKMAEFKLEDQCHYCYCGICFCGMFLVFNKLSRLTNTDLEAKFDGECPGQW